MVPAFVVNAHVVQRVLNTTLLTGTFLRATPTTFAGRLHDQLNKKPESDQIHQLPDIFHVFLPFCDPLFAFSLFPHFSSSFRQAGH